MDSTIVTPDGIEAIGTLMNGVIMGLIIMPLVQIIKNITFFSSVEPRYLVLALSIISVAILSQWLAPQMSVTEIINTALAGVGTATVTHLGYSKTKKKLNGG